jgi:uncharacterized protein
LRQFLDLEFDMNEYGIFFERDPSPAKLDVIGVPGWPRWRKEASTFHWTYDRTEICYLLRGSVTVTPDGGEPQTFERGDLITFPAGLSCTWEIHQDLEKQYNYVD